MAEINVEKIWNSIRGDDHAEYAKCDPDFRAKLGMAAGEAQQGRSTGIAGLEKFEEAVAGKAGTPLSQSGVDAGFIAGSGQARSSDLGTLSISETSGADVPATPIAKGTGAQKEEGKGVDKAAKDAAGAQQKVSADEVNSPSFPSAARPLGAEVPGTSAADTGEKGVGSKAAAKSGTKSASKTASKTAAKSSSKKAGK